MPNYRRAHISGGMFFFTLVAHQRRPLWIDPANVEYLRQAIRSVSAERKFDVVAGVVLPDHLHFIWSLPPDDEDYSWRIGKMKTTFTKLLRSASSEIPASPSVSQSRERRRESDVWQRRFWEHWIRDEHDLNQHLDYIHYNPVKHGLVPCPHLWPNSSFNRFVKNGSYDPDWQCTCAGKTPTLLRFDSLRSENME